jgi:hypothetical protein
MGSYSEESNSSMKQEQTFSESFRLDFKKRVSSFSDIAEAKGAFNRATQMTDRTFERYRKGDSLPTGNNILLLYSFIYDNADLDEVYSNLPQQALTTYKKSMKKTNKKSFPFNRVVEKSEIHQKLYILTMNGNIVFKEDFLIDYGQITGVSAIEDLANAGLIIDREGVISRGEKRSPFPAEEIKSHSSHLINSELTKEELDSEKLCSRINFNTYNFSSSNMSNVKVAVDNFLKELDNIEIESYNSNEKTGLVAMTLALKDYTKEGLQ